MAAPRRLVDTMLREACKHLGNGAQTIVTAMWALNAEGTVESAAWETLKSNLADYSAGDSALTQAVHKIDATLVRRSADPTALYSDRVGLLGPKWVDALETVCTNAGSVGQLLNEICGVL